MFFFLKTLKRRWIILSAFLLFPPACLAYAYFYEGRALRTVHYEVVSADLPAAFDGFKIVYISDTHHGCRRSFNLLPKVRRLAEKEKPDLLLFGGDYAESFDRDVFAECFAALEPLAAPYGKFGVLGNHDSMIDPAATLQLMEQKGGITPLNDAGVWLEKDGARIRVFGIDFSWMTREPHEYQHYEAALLDPADFVIFMPHSPDHYERFTADEKPKIDLVLAGHSHGGQVTVFGLRPVLSVIHHTQYLTGRVETEAGTTVITSNGVGTNVVPLRFFAPPQIVAVTLRRGEK